MNLNNYLQQTNKEEVKSWINHNLKNYLKKNEEYIGEIEHIVDYLNSDEAPTRLRKMSYEEAKENSSKWVAKMIKKAENVAETESDTEVVLDFKDGFKLVKLVGKSAYEREGNLMSHCVGDYYSRNQSKIYSLRDSKNNPHCTMEVYGDKNIQQIKGKGNGSIHPNYINYILQSLTHFGLDVRDSEMSNLGYKYYGDAYMKFFEENFENYKTVTYKGKVYIYEDLSKIKVKSTSKLEVVYNKESN